MRKHRLAERLLTDVIGLDWALVHAEACRWEHVMSETVERRLIELLDHPTESPYGNPIPGLDELGETGGEEFMHGVAPLSEFADGVSGIAGGGGAGGAGAGLDGAGGDGAGGGRALVRRISEELQKDEDLMATLRRVGALPDKVVTVARTPAGVLVGSGGETAEIDLESAAHIFVRRG
jgi:DtxR family Mn-dependent transcriptional regulator